MTEEPKESLFAEPFQYVDQENVFFPSALLIFTLILTVISTFWLSVNTYDNFKLIQEKVEETLDVNMLTYRIMRLDGILTESARLAAETGDAKWEKRYNEYVEELDQSIAKLKEIASKTSSAKNKKAAVDSTDKANIILVDLETQVFEKVNQNKLKEAHEIINGPKYHENKEIYAQGMESLIRQINSGSKDPLLTYARSSYYGLLPIVMTTVILAVFWFLTLRSLSTWRRELTLVRNTLSGEKKYLSTILDTMMQGVVTINAQGIILTFSKWAETLFGYKAEEVIGQNVSILMPEPYRSEHDAHLKTHLETGRARILDLARETVAKNKQGMVFPILLSVTKVETGDQPYFVGLIMDISQQKEKELKLRQAKREADQANKAKSDFLANMSHELRTPLNSILGLTKIMLSEDNLDEDSRENLSIIDKSSGSLLNTVNDILDLSKIEAGYIELTHKPFNANGLVLSLIDQIRPLASKKGLTVLSNVNKLQNLYLIGDEFRLFRILLNLASNSVKYTDQGKVEIIVGHEDIDDKKIHLICEIHDTGIGIPADKIERIFHKFTQADETIERRYGGTGLGLSITKHLTEIMGGSIKVQSTPGEGSTFTVKIPFEKTEGLNEETESRVLENVGQSDHPPIEDAKILIAEDHEFNKILITKIMARLGCKSVTIVENGKHAVEAFKDKSWDMILMDLHMPEMSGHQAAQRIRQIEAETKAEKHIPIVAMTADVMPGTREDCMKSGMNDYISKPVDEYYLRSILSNWFSLKDAKPLPKSEKKIEVETLAYKEAPASIQQPPSANLKMLKDYAGGSEDVLKQLASSFIDKSDTDMNMLESAIGSSDRNLWCATAHKIKGSAGYLSAEKLRQLCEKAQTMLDSKDEQRMDLFREIREEYDRVVTFIRKEIGLD